MLRFQTTTNLLLVVPLVNDVVIGIVSVLRGKLAPVVVGLSLLLLGPPFEELPAL